MFFKKINQEGLEIKEKIIMFQECQVNHLKN
ncbi:Uncharacterised protein [Clostridioides difficile]|nr:Uncharacterised protein [Clostridioides difficile]